MEVARLIYIEEEVTASICEFYKSSKELENYITGTDSDFCSSTDEYRNGFIEVK